MQDLSDNKVGSPASFAISQMVGSNNTLVSLGLRGLLYTVLVLVCVHVLASIVMLLVCSILSVLLVHVSHVSSYIF